MISITTKKDLKEYLEENDPEFLDFLTVLAGEFGPAETIIYVRHEEDDDRK